ncbi:hypothetical protein CL658_05100 [bacterium]|nr:hypothetical protein [bacterium]
MKYGEFQEPKPPRFPLFIDLRPTKTANIDTENRNFNDILDQKSNQNPEQKNTESQNQTKQTQINLAHSLLQTSLIHQGAKQLPHHVLANAEFIGKKQNFEGINNPSYINYAAAFQAGFNATSINDIKKKKKELQDPTKESEESEESEESSDNNTPASDLTYAHNLNLFKKLDDINPFKKMDKRNHKLFEDSPMYHMLNSNFMSPLNLLGEETFTKNQKIIADINTNSPTLEDAPDIYTDNNIKTMDIHSNYNSIENPNQDTSPQWETWSEDISAHYLLKRHADMKQYTKVIRQFSGNIKDQERHINRIENLQDKITTTKSKLDELTQNINSILKTTLKQINENPNIMNDPTVIEQLKSHIEDTNEISKLIEHNDETLSEEHQTEFIFYKTQLDQIIDLKQSQAKELSSYIENKALKKTKEWWKKIGKNLNQSGLLLPFGLMAESAEQVFKQSNLDINQSTETIPGKLNEKLIIDSATHLNQDFKRHDNKEIKTITAQDLMIDNLNYGEEIFKKLTHQNIINTNGKIINFDPDNMFPEFNLGSDTENNRIRKVLKSVIQGPSSLNTYDNTIINKHKREDIKLIDPDNNKWDLPTLLNSIPTDTSAKETFIQARKVYNILFDILETMSGDLLTKQGQLTPQLTETEHGITVPIYKHSEWLEYNDTILVNNDETNTTQELAGWEKIEGHPLEITFENTDKATEFFETIKTSILKLEPLVSSFNPNNDPSIRNKENHYSNDEIKETAIRVLIDNEGELGNKGIITKTSDSFRYDIDIIAQPTFFQTSHWKQISTYLKSSIMLEIGTAIFSKSQINQLNKKRHKQKSEQYKERKEKWEEEEYQRKVDTKKREAKQKRNRKEISKKQDNKIQKRKNENKKEIKKQEKKKEAERKKRLNENKKAASKKARNKRSK